MSEVTIFPQRPKIVNLRVDVGADITGDFKWFAADEEGNKDPEAPINFAAVECQIREAGTKELILDLGEYIEIDGNELHLYVPASVTEDLPVVAARWDLQATAAESGERRTLMRGRVLIRDEVSVPEPSS